MKREIGIKVVLSQLLWCPGNMSNILGPSTWNLRLEGTVESNGSWQRGAAQGSALTSGPSLSRLPE